MWPISIAELALSAAFTGPLVRTPRRYDRHLARIEVDLDRDRDAVIANIRAKVDGASAELKTALVANTGGHNTRSCR